ncbi:MAG: hypothetical protein A3B74_04220 [Candidatus Kerfeldbacteria bacterium RIFCSPHIGHO2_02_FULL_42_14]|uniref:Uncharacterized protein n=1 Tax=Candidatus Kerfeldbacteria bacterium RIFCSPHIGHO2_02_FULL_42_14 TaxID=1798540 RepID=A0A1G2AR89_9BACT|nr:MAG: hypothetical protein A3B74_04220 [Candidatus Kerfeldbacteria bacterium RIFCSPHIGHO2_02_FULL_42_14]OGY81194.1 MAG: hypothetical protein A3E60_02800 [Candidatus Kerfeldbacteria bacterium RIFCSPHIGHO2_12_FULL_42_13]OGY83386.1 MAG: hypothetical protein A3I91_01910 [Candidatus Kerfeldbacteria bacterium RIFCSPLOWO2_02_FULL_42_19]OGY85491.1 MAG: hypothetical protein A3G01_03595 [Candidatus Kerfeldbacteria bacterium RIFCSPLOWO2_12_FULL_43_9]
MEIAEQKNQTKHNITQENMQKIFMLVSKPTLVLLIFNIAAYLETYTLHLIILANIVLIIFISSQLYQHQYRAKEHMIMSNLVSGVASGTSIAIVEIIQNKTIWSAFAIITQSALWVLLSFLITQMTILLIGYFQRNTKHHTSQTSLKI